MDATACIVVSHDIYIENNQYGKDATPAKMKAKYSGAAAGSTPS